MTIFITNTTILDFIVALDLDANDWNELFYIARFYKFYNSVDTSLVDYGNSLCVAEA